MTSREPHPEDDDDGLDFLDEAPEAPVSSGPPWTVLVVDDDAEVHAMTRMLLADFRFEGRPLELLSATSRAEGEAVVRSRQDIALALLDVVMETDDAGLKLVQVIREELGNRCMSIVLRTGQPGSAPQEDIVVRYEIDDYREKTELTVQKLHTIVIAGLRHWRALSINERNRAGLERLLGASTSLADPRTPTELASEALHHIDLLAPGAEILLLSADAGPVRLLAGRSGGRRAAGPIEPRIAALVARGVQPPAEPHAPFVTAIDCRAHAPLLLAITPRTDVPPPDRNLIEVCAANLAVGFDNAQLYSDLAGLNRNLEQQIVERTRELGEKTRLLEAMLRSMSDGIAVFDRNGRLLLANERATAVLRLPAALARPGLPYRDLLNALRGNGAQITFAAEADGMPAVADARASLWDEITFTDGYAVQVRRSRMADGGWVHIFLDVAEERQREQELIAARAEAETAAKARAEVLAVMSHEIRTPISGIMGLTQLALGMTGDPRVEDHLQTIRYSGESLLTLINDLLDYSKIEAGGMRFEKHPFDLTRTMDGLVALMSSRATEKNLILSAKLAPELPRQLVGDSARLRQVMLNLVGNGLKFTETGSVTIFVELLQRGDDKARLRFNVVDTGIGIASDAQRRLFRSFVQADETIARRFGGTGLGLAICQRVIDLQGGRIGVDSSPGRGSRFWFELDFGVQSEQAIVVAADQTSRRSLNVLIAEDNPINQRVGVGLLERAGHRATLVSNGRAAVDTIAAGAIFDIVLMDLHMPEMDGITATRAIRALKGAASDVPIIAVTAAATRADVDAATAAGMNGFVSKPLDATRLNSALFEAVDAAQSSVELPDPDVVPFDPDTLSGVARTLGHDMVAGLIAHFFATADGYIDEISRALAEDPKRAAFLAHNLSGSASSLGCMRLARGAQRIEVACRHGRDLDITTEVAGLPTLLDEAHAHLRSFVPPPQEPIVRHWGAAG